MIASETALRHQPMNWRDSIWVSDIGLAVGVPDAVNAALSSPMKENTYCCCSLDSVARLGGLPPNWASFDRLGPENNALGG